MKLNNKYYIMRHGQATSNVKDIVSCWPEKFYNSLTEHGMAQAKATAQELKSKKINLIFCSPLLRTKETAEIVGKELDLRPKTDKRLKEQNAGVFNGLPFQNLKDFFGKRSIQRFKVRPKNGETYIDIQKRMLNFLKAVDKKYKNKNILIVSHELPLILLQISVNGLPKKDFFKKNIDMNTAELRKLN